MLRILKRQSAEIVKNGVNALDLIDGPPVSESTLVKSKIILEQNFGTEYSAEKWRMLAALIDEEGWTEERFQRTFKWFLKNKRFPAWTIADWFDYGVRIYPYTWYLEQVHKNGAAVNKQIEVYDLGNGVVGYRYADGETLPFPKWSPGEAKP